MVYIYLLLSALLILCTIVLVYHLRTKEITEPFVEQDVVYEVNENEYTLDINNTYNDQCMNAIIKPYDVEFTNIIHYMNIPDAKFIGISNEKRQYLIISKNPEITNISSIGDGDLIAYAYEMDKVLFDHLFKKVHKKTLRFDNIRGDKEYVNDYCNSYDNTNNMFIDFMTHF